MVSLHEIVEPLPLRHFTTWLFDGERYTRPTKATVHIEDGRIADIREQSEQSDLEMPDETITLLGGVSMHEHGRDAFGVFPGMPGDQSYKEDSYTLSLALAQGGATFGMCMLNFEQIVENKSEYVVQLDWMNTKLTYREKPIMKLDAYIPIRPGSKPSVGSKNTMFKLFWNTFGGANFPSDEDVRETLRNYADCYVKAHCESIDGIIDVPGYPHHYKRPKEAAINATRLFLACAQDYNFIPEVAHLGTAEELCIIKAFNAFRERRVARYEITPQSLALDHSTFESATGLKMIWGQQNPPLRSYADRQELIKEIDDDAIYGPDHAPHKDFEKLKGMSGMPQASTAGQIYLEEVTLGHDTLRSFVRKRSLNGAQILEDRLGYKMGKLEKGYDASFTLVTLGRPSRIRDENVLSKCAWTPYKNWTFSNTIEGVIVNGTLYTQAALQKLRPKIP